MLAFEPLLLWDRGDNRFWFISCPKTRIVCLLDPNRIQLSTSMLAFKPLLPWDGGDDRFRSISCPKTSIACLLGLGELDAVNASNFNEHARF